MSGVAYYGPANETPTQIFLERTFLNAGYLTGFGYGVQLALYLACAKILWERASEGVPYRKTSWFLLGYISVLCILDTMWTGVSAYGLQATFIDNRNYPSPDGVTPGGPIAFLNVEFTLPFNIVGQIVFTLGNIMADALLLWRCRVIWTSSSGRTGDYVIAFPALMLLANTAMGIMFGIETCSPEGSGLFGSGTASFAIPYFAISLSLNIILTLLIVGKIWFHQREMAKAFGNKNFGRYYSVIVMMFIESAAMYSIISILVLVTFALGNPINQIWLGLSPAVQMTSNYLIIYRVAHGKAWSSNTTITATQTNSINFVRTSSDRQLGKSTDTGSDAALSIPLSRLREEKHAEAMQTVKTMQISKGQTSSHSWGTDDEV